MPFSSIFAEPARQQAEGARVRFLPEIERIRAAAEAKPPIEVMGDMLAKAADIMDAQADFLQGLIDACDAASLTHEQLIVRLRAGLEPCRVAARCMRREAASPVLLFKRPE